MVGFGISGGETSGSSSREPDIYYDGQLGNEIQRKRGGWNWLRIIPKWWALVSVVVKLLVLVPESQLITLTDSLERDPEEERWTELAQNHA
jgi:hypothetical protein